MAALGLTMDDLFADSPKRASKSKPTGGAALARATKSEPKKPSKPAVQEKTYGEWDAWPKLGKPTTIYNYIGLDGELKHQTLRFALPDGDKTFRQQRPDGKGRFIHNLTPLTDAGQTILYNYPEFVAADPAAWVFLVEGEKDVDNVRAAGLISTTNPMGAKGWRSHFNGEFAGRRVCVLPDNDESGRSFRDTVTAALVGVAATVRVLELPGLPVKGDVSDWLEAGGTAEELLRLAEAQADAITPVPEAATAYTNGAGPESKPRTYPFNDTGNAQRLIDECGESLIYVERLGWHVWDGARWRADTEGLLAGRMSRNIARNLYERAWQDLDQDLSKWALRSGEQGRINGALAIAKLDESVLRYVDDLDADPWLLNCANGTLDLRTGRLRPHSQSDLITKITPIAYDPAAACPTWLAHLSTVFKGDAEIVELFRVFCGMALTGDVSQEAWLFAQGGGKNGKTVTLTTIHKMLGEYALALSSDALLVKRSTDAYELADLRGIRAAFAYELPDGRFNANRLKKLASNEPFTARQIFTRQITFKPTHTLFVSGNSKPSVSDTSDGFWRRMTPIPFEHRFTKQTGDAHFAKKLEAELPGILAWAVYGCRRWIESGLPESARVEEAAREYKAESNPTARFIEEQCLFDDEARIAVDYLYEAYRTWAELQGEKADTNRSFGIQFSQLAPSTTVKVSNSRRYRLGVKLRAQPLPRPDED